MQQCQALTVYLGEARDLKTKNVVQCSTSNSHSRNRLILLKLTSSVMKANYVFNKVIAVAIKANSILKNNLQAHSVVSKPNNTYLECLIKAGFCTVIIPAWALLSCFRSHTNSGSKRL